MSWIRFWHQGKCPSGLNDEESSYAWYDRPLTEEQLKSEAEERVPEWRRSSERGYRCGFERVKRLPAKARQELITSFKGMKAYAEAMLVVLQRGTRTSQRTAARGRAGA